MDQLVTRKKTDLQATEGDRVTEEDRQLERRKGERHLKTLCHIIYQNKTSRDKRIALKALSQGKGRKLKHQ